LKEEVIQYSMQPEVASGSSSAGSRVLVAMVPAKDRQSDDSSGTTQGGLRSGNNAVAIRDGVKSCLLMCDEIVSLVGWQTMLLVYAAGQIAKTKERVSVI
jgi:hypothetical protein